MTDIPQFAAHPSRRRFLGRAALVAAGPATAAILGPTLIPSSAAHADVAPVDDLPSFAPVPPSAFGPALNADGYFVGPIKDNLYWVTDGFYQSMFLATAHGMVVVDAPPTIGHNLLRAINQVTAETGTPSTVTHLVHTHFHADHIGASSIFGDGVVRVGHVENRRLLHEAGDPNRPAPTLTFKERHVLDFGTDRLELAYHGPNHTPDNVFIYAPRQRTLMVVDVLFPGWVPFKNLAVSQDIPGWVRAHDITMDYRWTTFRGRPRRPPRRTCRRRPAATVHPGSGRKHQADVGLPRPDSVLPEVRAVGQRLGDLQDLPRRPRTASRRPHRGQIPRQAGGSRRLHCRQRLRDV